MVSKNKSTKRRKKKSKPELKPKTLVTAILIAVSAAALISFIIFLCNHSKNPQQIYDFQKSVAHGIDVSEHNGKIDWDAVSKDFDFAFIRVGYRGYGNGEIYTDKRAKENLKAAQKAGIPFGVYFYTQAVNEEEAEEEAEFVLSTIKHYNPKLPLVIDFEYPADKDGNPTGRLSDSILSPSDNTDIVNAFCKRIENKGYIAGIYASSGVLYHNLELKHIGKQTLIWAADYNSNVTFDIDYDVWQYSKTGQNDALGSKYVDLNYWYSKNESKG